MSKYSKFLTSLLVLSVILTVFYACKSSEEITNSSPQLYDPGVDYGGNNIFRFSQFTQEGRSDREALQAMFDAVPKSAKTAVFDLQGASLKLDGTVYYHKNLERRTKVIGNNARIEATGDFDILVEDRGFGMKVSNGSTEEDIARWMDSFHISDVDFVGGRTQLRIVGTLQSKVENCRFWNSYRGLQMVFCLQAVVNQCRFQNQTLEGLVIRSGISDEKLIQEWMGNDYPVPESDKSYFSNASGTNSQSNRVIVSNCRFYARTDQKTCVRSQASDGVRIDNCIFEGGPSKHSIYHDSRGSTTVRSFEVISAHIEHGNPEYTESLIRAHGGVIEITGLYSQYGGVVQLDADGEKIIIERPRYVPIAENMFKMGKSSKWKFIEVEMDPKILSDPKSWVNQNVPREAIQISHSTITALNKTGMSFNSIKTGAQMRTVNTNPNLPLFSMRSNADKPSDFEHNIKRVFDYNTVLKDKGKGMSLDGYVLAGAIPVLAEDENGVRRTVYWPLIEKK